MRNKRGFCQFVTFKNQSDVEPDLLILSWGKKVLKPLPSKSCQSVPTLIDGERGRKNEGDGVFFNFEKFQFGKWLSALSTTP